MHEEPWGQIENEFADWPEALISLSMISIIICSRDQKMLRDVSQNVAETIGVPYEIVPIVNDKGQYNIFQAYNQGIRRSKYDMLCFMHEDIGFETADWGKKVLDLFATHPKLGLLGVAGSSYKSLMPSGWSFEYAFMRTVKINVIQHYKSGSPTRHICHNPEDKPLSKVASVDGLWFCTPKAVAEEIKFDEHTFNNFHCYDIDYSLAVLQNYDVAVTFEVLINHFSEGSPHDTWLEQTLKLHNKWQNILPVHLDEMSFSELKHQEFSAFHGVLPQVIGKRKMCLDFVRIMWNDKIRELFGVRKLMLMQLTVAKKAFQ